MTREILPFEQQHVAAAASLLARRHRVARDRDARLPAAYASEDATAPLVEELRGRASGVVAVEQGRVVGYLLGAHDFDSRGRARLVPMEGHGVDHPDGSEVYREMYAAASPAWVEEGYFQHLVSLEAGDEAAAAAFNSLGFGQVLALGLRDTSPIGADGGNVRVERATEADIDAVQAMMTGLGRYNSTSPLFRPFVAEPYSEWPRLPFVRQQMADEQCSYWLAYDGDRPVALMIFTPPEPAERMVNPANSVYLWIAYVRPGAREGGAGKALVEAGLAWARSLGHEYCSVGWFTANVTGARFWTRRGFTPVMYRLERRLDERIAWARAVEDE